MRGILLVAMLCGSAQAAPSGAEILEKVDHGLNCFKDGTFESHLYVKEGGQSREYAFTTYQKGGDRRLVKFSAPGDVKGMGVLVENKETMYVFLPGFQRIRRMGSHVKNQTFMGSDFSYEDISLTNFSGTYTADFVSEDASGYVIDLKPKPKMDVEYPRIRMYVEKTHFSPMKMEYFDAAGKKVKTQLRDGYYQDSPEHWQPKKVVVIDHRRGDHTSEILFTGSKLDSGLSDDLFTQRSLLR